jgi:hypothetical protein
MQFINNNIMISMNNMLNIINNNNNYGIESFFDTIAQLLAEHYVVVVGLVIGILSLNTFIRIIVDTAFDLYDYYTDPLIIRQRNNKNNKNNSSICSRNNTIIHNSQCGRRMEDEPLNSQASSIPAVHNNNNNNKNRNNNNNNNRLNLDKVSPIYAQFYYHSKGASYFYLPQDHHRQTIRSSALQNMPRRNVRFVPPEETKNHRRPPLYRNVVQKPASIGNNNHSENMDSNTSYHSDEATTTTIIDGNEDKANKITIDMIAVSPLLMDSPEVKLLASAPVFLPNVTSPGVEFEMEGDDEDSITAEDYFFSLPDNFGGSSAKKVDKLEDVASLCWSYSETSEDEDDDDNVAALLMEEFEEMDADDEDSTTAEHSLFSLPDNFGDSSASATINNVVNLEEDVPSLCWSYSEMSEAQDDDENVSALLMEEFGEIEADNEDSTTAEHYLFSLPDNFGDSSASATIPSFSEPSEDEDDDNVSALLMEEFEDMETSNTTAPLLGTIWVKHPKHGCMVRRSVRLLRPSRLD